MQSNTPVAEQAVLSLTGGSEKLWLANEQILCYRFTETSRTTVDAAIEDVRAEMLAWARNRFWRLMLEVRDTAVISAYGLNRARELTRLRPDVSGKLAVVTNNVLTAQIAALALRGLPNERRRRLVFSNDVDAVAWLLQDDKII